MTADISLEELDLGTDALQRQLVAVGEGGWVLVVVALLILAGAIYGYYTRTGSGIEEHPRGRRRPDRAPGAQGPSEVSGRDEGERDPLDQHGAR